MRLAAQSLQACIDKSATVSTLTARLEISQQTASRAGDHFDHACSRCCAVHRGVTGGTFNNPTQGSWSWPAGVSDANGYKDVTCAYASIVGRVERNMQDWVLLRDWSNIKSGRVRQLVWLRSLQHQRWPADASGRSIREHRLCCCLLCWHHARFVWSPLQRGLLVSSLLLLLLSSCCCSCCSGVFSLCTHRRNLAS